MIYVKGFAKIKLKKLFDPSKKGKIRIIPQNANSDPPKIATILLRKVT